MLNIVLFGAPGAGKGTQSGKILKKYNLLHLATGDLLRGEIAAGTELGLKAKAIMERGELVPDDVVIGMISSKIHKHKNKTKGFIFDGFPRTTEQAEALDKLLEDHNSSITKLIALDVDKEELIHRLLLRGKESGRPDDRNKEIIENRLTVYLKTTTPVKNYYEKQNKFEKINGMGKIEEIFDRVCLAIEN